MLAIDYAYSKLHIQTIHSMLLFKNFSAIKKF